MVCNIHVIAPPPPTGAQAAVLLLIDQHEQTVTVRINGCNDLYWLSPRIQQSLKYRRISAIDL